MSAEAIVLLALPAGFLLLLVAGALLARALGVGDDWDPTR